MHNLLMPLAIDKDEIMKKAISLGEDQGYLDIVALANEYGVKVFNEELDSDRSGFVRYDADSDSFSIYANVNQSKQRQRFSIAHELAHLVLHEDKIREQGEVDRENTMSLSLEEENEADQLAADILMPEPTVRDYVEVNNLDGNKPLEKEAIEKISDSFNVSMPMAIIRMRDLGYYVPFLSL